MSKLDKFYEEQGFNEPMTQERYKRDVTNANKARAKQIFFIYKALKRHFPDIDIEGAITEGCYEYGKAGKGCIAGAQDAADALLGQSSFAGVTAFEQTFNEVGENFAQKTLEACPIVDGLREAGANPQECADFCKVIMGAADYGLMDGKEEEFVLSFPKNLAENDVCIMRVEKK